MAYEHITDIREDPALRESFFDLARQVFDLDFAPWYEGGFWTDRYRPVVLADHTQVVANVSVNSMEFEVDGARRRYAQLGTVMVHPAYRGQGLARRLLSQVTADLRGTCDAVYLFANQQVLNFYPKFGFSERQQYGWELPVHPVPGDMRRLDMSSTAHRQILRDAYRQGAPFSAFPMVENEGLLFFYCAGPLKDCVYHSPSLGVVCVAEQEQDALICYDVFGAARGSFHEILAALCRPGTVKVQLGFTPKEPAGQPFVLPQQDDQLFLLEGSEDLFLGEKRMFPLLAHA